MRAILSIGSNIGDSAGFLQSVLDDLGSAATAVSSVYATAPWGGVEQQDFLNAAVAVDHPDLDGWGWLARGQALEESAHRRRVVRWGPRSLDVDVVVVRDGSSTDGPGVDVRSDHPDLLLPHPRAHERAFVLVPWIELEPDGTLDIGAGPVPLSEHLAALPGAERESVRRTDVVLHRTDGPLAGGSA